MRFGKVSIDNTGVCIEGFQFGNFKPIDMPCMVRGGIEAMQWAKQKLDEAILEASMYHRDEHRQYLKDRK